MLSIHVWPVTAYWTLQFRTLRQTGLFALILKLFPEHPLCQVTSQFSPRKLYRRTFPSSQKALFESAAQVRGTALTGKIHFRVRQRTNEGQSARCRAALHRQQSDI